MIAALGAHDWPVADHVRHGIRRGHYTAWQQGHCGIAAVPGGRGAAALLTASAGAIGKHVEENCTASVRSIRGHASRGRTRVPSLCEPGREGRGLDADPVWVVHLRRAGLGAAPNGISIRAVESMRVVGHRAAIPGAERRRTVGEEVLLCPDRARNRNRRDDGQRGHGVLHSWHKLN